MEENKKSEFWEWVAFWGVVVSVMAFGFFIGYATNLKKTQREKNYWVGEEKAESARITLPPDAQKILDDEKKTLADIETERRKLICEKNNGRLETSVWSRDVELYFCRVGDKVWNWDKNKKEFQREDILK